MAEILKEWLTERLQRPIKWEAEEFGDMMRNGHIISNVLLSYHVINDEQHYLIRSSNAKEDIDSNWQYLNVWLKELEITLTGADLKNIKEGVGSTILRLFYQLFLHLDKKDRIDFLKKERKMVSKLVDKMESRFNVKKVPEDEISEVDDLSKPLLNEKHFIEWQRKKEAQIKDTYEFMRHMYLKTCAKIEEGHMPINYKAPQARKLAHCEKVDIQKFAQRYPCKFANYTYEELLELEQKANENKEKVMDTEWAKEYMDNLHDKMRNRSDSEKFQKQMSNVLSTSLWDMSVAEEETKYETELAKKVMKLSQFEKQMCTQIMETKQQARNLVKNRTQAQKEFADQRLQQFNQYFDDVREQIHLELVEIDFEKERQNMLHRRLYAEKIKRKRQHYYEICYDTVLALVDFASKYAHFKYLIGDEIPEHFILEWKAVFYKMQPIFDIMQQIEDVLEEHGLEEEVASEEELIVRLELDRQDCMNKSDFEDYHNYKGLWILDYLIPNFEPEAEEHRWQYLGLRVLGHVVFTLLEIKYPYPPERPPADLPDYTSKALLRQLPDRAITIPMQTLLNFRKIFVVRLESAINYCLKKYKIEMIGCQDIEISFDKFITLAPEECKEILRLAKAEEIKEGEAQDAKDTKKSDTKETKKSDTKKSDAKESKKSDTKESKKSGNASIPPNVKQTQTPKTIPEEDIVLSIPAELGKYAYEALCSGDSLTDHLLAAMIVELIKNQIDIDGFVIINYPNSYREAHVLEETFSGKPPPEEENLDDRDEIYLEESIQKHRKKEKDQYKLIRVSRLVIDPHKKDELPPFVSYFTSYIRLKDSVDILQEQFIWYLTEDNSELIDRFYASLGINYSLYYELIEKEFLAHLCKYIIGDFDLPIKSFDDLFGEGVLSTLEFATTEDKRLKSKTVKPEVAKDKKKEAISSKISLEVIKEETAVQEPESALVLEEVDDDNKSKSVVEEEIIILAGEEDWVYGKLPITESIGVALATIWEETEKAYLHDIEELFFAKRLQMNCLVPYARFLKDKMEQIITLPSNKQDLVSKFQYEYNTFEDDWRNTNVSKNEWHCRIKGLQHRLYHICDERKVFAETQREGLITDNWAMDELTSMVNTYISCMQAELNRSVLTYQILHDFYVMQLKNGPTTDRLASKDLIKITREIDEGLTTKKLSAEDKVYRQLKNAFIDMQLKNITIDISNNPFNIIIENNVKFIFKTIKDLNDSYRTIINKENTDVSKVSPPPRKKDDPIPPDDEVPKEEIYKMNGFKCIEEWTTAVNGEMYRLNLRILALQFRCYHDMKLFNDYIYKTFTDIQDNINNYYMNEIKAVDRLCKYFQMAVEKSKKIEETLLLENDAFIIDPNLLQYIAQEPPPEPELQEEVEDNEFKVGQLARLRALLRIVAPNGIAMHKAFIYLIQDFLFYSKETCEGSVVPQAWRKLDPEEVPKLVYQLFGEVVYVDWRDFLIYCLNLRYPTVDELLHLRKRLRCIDEDSTELIDRENFLNEELWFEIDFDPDSPHSRLRLCLIKHFLFELYEVSPNMMNYSAFLLAYCKDVDPIVGFTTAVSMAVGKKTCNVVEECEEVIQKMIKLKEYRDACVECAHRCAAEFLETLLTQVINECEGTIITELEYVEEELPDKKKKGKGSQNAKSKADGSQSARLPKSKSFENKNKVTQSDTNIKMTYICKPCVEEAREEVIPEEEARSVSIQPDPELVYSVSQDVIWNVLRSCMPWPFVYIPEQKVSPYIEQVEDVLKALENDTHDGSIYIIKFVNDPRICKMLHKMKKFYALNLLDQVRKLLHQ